MKVFDRQLKNEELCLLKQLTVHLYVFLDLLKSTKLNVTPSDCKIQTKLWFLNAHTELTSIYQTNAVSATTSFFYDSGQILLLPPTVTKLYYTQLLTCVEKPYTYAI